MLSNWQNGQRCYDQKPFLCIESETNPDVHEHATPMERREESSLGPSANRGCPAGPSCWCRWQILSAQPYPALPDALLTFQWLIMDSLLWRNSSLGDDSFHRQDLLHSCIHSSHCRKIRVWLPSLYFVLRDRKVQLLYPIKKICNLT